MTPDELTVDRTVVRPESPPGAVRRVVAALRALLARDRLVLATLLVLAAAVRLPGLAARGRFDGDQGYDMLTLLNFTQHGVFPLLGPPTSIGDFHHGAFYYLLLAPVAALSGSDPFAVTLAIALMGIAAVGVTWWLGRSIGGPVAGAIAGLLLAFSPAGLEQSTFIWNPNPLPLFAAISLAAAWRAHTTGRARWWVLSLASAGAVFQLHVLGIVFLPPIVAFLVFEIRRARRRHDPVAARRLLGAGLAGFGLIALLFVPLAIHELQTGFSETQRVIAYLTGPPDSRPGLDPLERPLFALFRIVGWPFVGLVTDATLGATIVFGLVIVLGIWRAIVARGEDALAIRWLSLTALWSALALGFVAPSLQTVVAGLPNDHYHAFLDPVVIVIVAIAGAAIVAPGPASRRDSLAELGSQPSGDVAARTLVALAIVLLVGLEVSRWPPPDPNGGWSAAQASGVRIVGVTGTATISMLSVPTFKPPDGTTFPIVKAGGTITNDPWSAGFIVVPCDRLFEAVVGAPCGGPAEDQLVQKLAAASGHPVPTLVTRFDASPRISVTIYRP
jgi:hypothetical protein